MNSYRATLSSSYQQDAVIRLNGSLLAPSVGGYRDEWGVFVRTNSTDRRV